MNELTFAYKDEAFTNSLIIAEGTGVEHNSIQLLIKNYKNELEELGRVRFEIEPLMTKGGIRKVKICRLNEQQATFLITLMRNTPVVVEFKKELVKQFFEMREFIKALVDSRKDYAND
ncbi:MAG: Rha family transcriptional regulator [Ruminococcus sp.]|nr:Rha family transcriptional regulator [Ruminococcus sp.]